VDIELRGTASGLVNTTAQLGAALGTAGAILVASVTGPGTAWALAAGVAVLAAAWFARPAGKRSGVDGTGPV
jgi:hypothetical protein